MIPHASRRLQAWRAAREHAGRIFIALDFDGTLAPIVERPEEAEIDETTREALRRLARRPDSDVAIVSGRALDDVRDRVAVDGLVYAGNHGMEIEGPGLSRIHQEAADARPALAACADELRRALQPIDGVFVEDKGITLSVHYRLASEPDAERRVRDFARACAERAGLRLTHGKKVVELRPDVEWDKGRATRFILAALEAGHGNAVPALFIGDDVTDEDAFRAVGGQGDGVIVHESPPTDTHATAYLSSTDEVVELLLGLAL